MVVPIGYKGLGILVLNSFMVAPVIRICGLSLSKYISFALLGNAAWLDIVDVVVASPILPVLGFLVVHFCIHPNHYQQQVRAQLVALHPMVNQY